MKLHLGCGSVQIPGFVNIDCRYVPGVDVVCDIRYLRGYENVDAIYACHVLEHFSRWDYMNVLKRWHTILRKGGEIYLSVPDLESVVEYYNETKDLRTVIGLLYGGQDYPENNHHMGWDFNLLKEDLSATGFKSIKKYDWETGPNPDLDDYSKAYLPHMNRSGHLMSLNMKALK